MINCSKSVPQKFQNSLSRMNDKGVYIYMRSYPGVRVVMLLQACEAPVKLVHAGCTNLALVHGSQFVVLVLKLHVFSHPLACLLILALFIVSVSVVFFFLIQ